jgi:hypothetical protein
MDEKLCKYCNIVKTFDLFEKHKTCINGITNRCKDCQKLYKQEFKRKYPDRVKSHRKQTPQESYKRELERYSGNWKYYFRRLLNHKDRKQISLEQIMELYEKQNGKCVLTGIDMTCIKEPYKRYWTNASIDRIRAGQEYTIDNVQLVCSIANLMRTNNTVDEFIYWCKKVVEHNS